MTTGAIAIILGIITQTVALLVAIFKVGKWVDSVNASLVLLNVHIQNDKVLHENIEKRINILERLKPNQAHGR